MEFLLAGLADHSGQRVVGAVNDTEADHTVLHSREVLVQVALPQKQTIHQGTILYEMSYSEGNWIYTVQHIHMYLVVIAWQPNGLRS